MVGLTTCGPVKRFYKKPCRTIVKLVGKHHCYFTDDAICDPNVENILKGNVKNHIYKPMYWKYIGMYYMYIANDPVKGDKFFSDAYLETDCSSSMMHLATYNMSNKASKVLGERYLTQLKSKAEKYGTDEITLLNLALYYEKKSNFISNDGKVIDIDNINRDQAYMYYKKAYSIGSSFASMKLAMFYKNVQGDLKKAFDAYDNCSVASNDFIKAVCSYKKGELAYKMGVQAKKDYQTTTPYWKRTPEEKKKSYIALDMSDAYFMTMKSCWDYASRLGYDKANEALINYYKNDDKQPSAVDHYTRRLNHGK
jgi:hypothetical protein